MYIYIHTYIHFCGITINIEMCFVICFDERYDKITVFTFVFQNL